MKTDGRKQAVRCGYGLGRYGWMMAESAEGGFGEMDIGTGMIPAFRFPCAAGHISVCGRLAEAIGIENEDPILPGYHVYKGSAPRSGLSPREQILSLGERVWSRAADGDEICFVKRGEPVLVYTVRMNISYEAVMDFAYGFGLQCRLNDEGNFVTLFSVDRRGCRKCGAGWIPLCAPAEVICECLAEVEAQFGAAEETVIGTFSPKRGRFSVVGDGDRNRFREGEYLDVELEDQFGHYFRGELCCTGFYRGYGFADGGAAEEAGFGQDSVVYMTIRRELAC